MKYKDASLVVRKTKFDNHIYEVLESRNETEKYLSSAQLADKLNSEKVLVLKGKKVIFRNFITLAEAIG